MTATQGEKPSATRGEGKSRPPTVKDDWAGLALMPGGLASMTSMMGAGRQVSRFVQPRYMMAGALLAISLALYHFTALAPEADFWWFAWARVFQMVGIPFLFLTITSYSYVGLPWGKSGQASALINVARNLGGSIGISAVQTLLARTDTLKQASAYFLQHGSSAPEAQRQAIAWIGQTLTNQAALLSYIDVFAYLSLFALALVPASFLLQRVDLRSGQQRQAAPSH